MLTINKAKGIVNCARSSYALSDYHNLFHYDSFHNHNHLNMQHCYVSILSFRSVPNRTWIWKCLSLTFKLGDFQKSWKKEKTFRRMVIKAIEWFFQLARKRINLLAISSNPPTNWDEPLAKRHIFVLQKSLEILKRPNTFYGQTVFLPNFSYNLKKFTGSLKNIIIKKPFCALCNGIQNLHTN